MTFDKIIHKTFYDGAVDYGFVFGNNKIVFIKSESGEDIFGYQKKYLKMAHRVHERTGATVICSSNYISYLELDRKAIEWCARKLQIERESAELYFVGTSKSATQCIALTRNAPTKKLICINPSFAPGYDPSNSLIIRSEVEKIFVYGTKDEEGCFLIPKLKEREIPNFQIKMIEGADHQFTGMIDEFISLIDLI